MRYAWLALFLALTLDFPLLAQIYPGGYPGGRGGIGGLPIPGRKSRRTGAPKDNETPAASFTGTLRKLDGKTITIEQESRVFDFERSRRTTFYKKSQEIKASDLKPGDRVTVEATRDEMGYLHALNVYLEDPQPATAPAGTPEDDDKDRPVLRRHDAGEPAAAKPAPSPDEPDSAHPAVIERISPGEPQDPLIEKARLASASLTESLPNYICQEMMARFYTNTPAVSWQPVDVVSAEVVYEDGRESYRNLAINGKAVKKNMEELSGSWSTGEFGTLLVDLFSPATAARFRRRTDSRIAGQSAAVFDFDVEREHSHWNIHFASQTVLPAYRGSVWTDKNTGRVLRVESQARDLPPDFPADQVESAVDYQYVHFGTAQFLLPVHAETLSCERGTKNCSRNAIDFRNCRKYTSETEITFERPK